MTSEAVEGLSRLRIAAILSAIAYPLFIVGMYLFIIIFIILIKLLSTPIGEVPEIPADIPLGTLIAGSVLFTIAGLLMLVAWIFRVLGWWSMRKLGWRRKEFYTVTWLAVFLGPIVALLLMIIGAVIDIPATLLTAFTVAGTLIVAIVGVIEGVALLDVGLRTKVKLLSASSVVYVIAALVFLLPEGITAAAAVGLVANLFLAIGFNEARGVVVARKAQ